jgi:hypothetical protein
LKWKCNVPRETFEIQFGDINLEVFRTNHIPDSSVDWTTAFAIYGVLINGRVLHPVDTQFNPNLINYYYNNYNIEHIFHDVQFFPGAVHAPLEDLKTLPDDIKAKMSLVHYSDNYEEQDITGFYGWTKQGVSYVFEKD